MDTCPPPRAQSPGTPCGRRPTPSTASACAVGAERPSGENTGGEGPGAQGATQAHLCSQGPGDAHLLGGRRTGMKAALSLTRGPAGTMEAPGMGGSTPPVPTPVPMGPQWESRGHWAETVSVSPGPADVHFVWKKNGQELETCIPTQTHVLPNGRAHVLSWLRDAIRESAEYRCYALSSTGNRSSKVRVTVERHGEWCSWLRRRARRCPGGGQGRGAWPLPGQPPRRRRRSLTRLPPGPPTTQTRRLFAPWRVWEAGSVGLSPSVLESPSPPRALLLATQAH